MGNEKGGAASSPGQKKNQDQTQYKIRHGTARNAAEKKINGRQEHIADHDYRDPGADGIKMKAVTKIHQEDAHQGYGQRDEDQVRVGPRQDADNYRNGSEEYAAEKYYVELLCFQGKIFRKNIPANSFFNFFHNKTF
jgi:hypothetical protein